MAQELHWKAPILVAEGRNRCWHVATSPPPSVRLWLSPTDRRQLTKVRERIAEITRPPASHSALLRARITTLELSADTVSIDRQKQPETKRRCELALLWWLWQRTPLKQSMHSG